MGNSLTGPIRMGKTLAIFALLVGSIAHPALAEEGKPVVAAPAQAAATPAPAKDAATAQAAPAVAPVAVPAAAQAVPPPPPGQSSQPVAAMPPPEAQATPPPEPEEEIKITLPADIEKQVEEGVKAFKDDKFDKAKQIFTTLQTKQPDQPLAAYYLGLIALKGKDTRETVKQWRQYARVDPDGAESNNIPKRLTILELEQNQTDMRELLKQEDKISKKPPEPNSIAVFPFVNQGDEKYQILSKGLTALIISDLAKVPGLKILEREKVQKLVDEINLSGSGLASKENQSRAGKMLRAEKIMGGVFNVEGGK